MFTQTTSQCAGSGSIQVAHKKRKLEHVSSAEYGGSLRSRLGNGQLCKSPVSVGGVPQNFIRASTIKLLDTYQRCGQKVSSLLSSLLNINYSLMEGMKDCYDTED